MLNRDQILRQTALPRATLDVPEWGGTVTVRGLTGAERDAFEAGCMASRGGVRNLANARARLVCLAVCDEEGTRLFSDGDAAAIGQLSAAALDRVFELAARLSGMTASDQEEMLGN